MSLAKEKAEVEAAVQHILSSFHKIELTRNWDYLTKGHSMVRLDLPKISPKFTLSPSESPAGWAHPNVYPEALPLAARPEGSYGAPRPRVAPANRLHRAFGRAQTGKIMRYCASMMQELVVIVSPGSPSRSDRLP